MTGNKHCSVQFDGLDCSLKSLCVLERLSLNSSLILFVFLLLPLLLFFLLLSCASSLPSLSSPSPLSLPSPSPLSPSLLSLPPSLFRSPSPEPIYSHDGKRLNTREVRVRKRLEDERHDLVQQAVKLSAEYKPPADYK